MKKLAVTPGPSQALVVGELLYLIRCAGWMNIHGKKIEPWIIGGAKVRLQAS